MMDGASTMDTGSNRPLLQMNIESIAEVKVLTSGYQAEYGRASGVQVTAVAKSGTNRFRSSIYDVERDSASYSNSKTNKLNGDPKPVLREKDWGYSIGGPVGKPGGNNKLFFFYAQELAPRTAGNNVVRFRMPTALERMGDSRRPPTTTATRIPSSATRCWPTPAVRPIRQPVSATKASSVASLPTACTRHQPDEGRRPTARPTSRRTGR